MVFWHIFLSLKKNEKQSKGLVTLAFKTTAFKTKFGGEINFPHLLKTPR